MDRITLKSMAREQIRGHLWPLFLCYLIVTIITSAAAMIPGIGSIASLALSAPLEIGLITIFFKLRNGESPKVSELFNHFDCFAHALLLYVLTGIFTMLWSLLFIIPGIVAALSYSMAPYILAENKNLTAMEALNLSKQMMNGHKADLFILQLSFIGWGIVTALTCGVAGIYVAPYMQATMVNFYDSIKGYTNIDNAEVYDE